MTEHTSSIVSQAKAALQGVTPGPWWTEPEGTVRPDQNGLPRYDLPRVVRFTEDGQSVCKTHLIGGRDPDPAIANAKFIASARELVPAMVERIEELENENNALREGARSIMSSTRKAYVVTAIDQGKETIGYRTVLVAAVSAEEAIGCAIKNFEESEPNHRYYKSTAMLIDEDALEEIGVSINIAREKKQPQTEEDLGDYTRPQSNKIKPYWKRVFSAYKGR